MPFFSFYTWFIILCFSGEIIWEKAKSIERYAKDSFLSFPVLYYYSRSDYSDSSYSMLIVLEVVSFWHIHCIILVCLNWADGFIECIFSVPVLR